MSDYIERETERVLVSGRFVVAQMEFLSSKPEGEFGTLQDNDGGNK